ncbi:hypothetical protein BLNAU_18260 [Blattamonas nauphoetae]|uniref:Protein kinase domain-containing protein n=1 Tax=Blattamonas nauphoetae TaxID=2049346 RepID=A0ABQ9X4V4_9EUKA|nr:hypothetical protein BLNAU_18260 [Blattamonas nauphoetae]
MAQSVLDNMKSWIPLVLALVLLALFFIVILVCIRRRRKIAKDKSEEPKQELDAIEVKEDFECGNPNPETWGLSPSRTDIVVRSNETFNEDERRNELNTKKSAKESESTLCVGCMEPFELQHVNSKRSLYHVLHEEKATLDNARQTQIRIAKGLEHISLMNMAHPVLFELTSHYVLTGGDGSIWLMTSGTDQIRKSLDKKGEQTASADAPAALPNKEGDEAPRSLQEDKDADQPMLQLEEQHVHPSFPPPHPLHSSPQTEKQNVSHLTRWMAPEQGKNKEMNGKEVSVFRLGLVLYEIETGLVPFGETDAMNAHRQLETGIVPPLDRVVKSEMRDLIRECLSVDPKLRPTLSSIASTLESIEESPNAVKAYTFIS